MHISRSNNLPIAISMGDPSGIGPEVILKALKGLKKSESATFLIIGDHRLLENLNTKLSTRLNLVKIDERCIGRGSKSFSGVRVLDLNNAYGAYNSKTIAGKASLEYIDKFIALYKRGMVSSLVTAPVSKENIKLVSKGFSGHTEYLAKKFNITSFAMMFAGGPFNVILATTHIRLRSVPSKINKKLIIDKVILIDSFFKKYYNIKKASIGVTGLNPHSGENGTIGDEEVRVIKPACDFLRDKGFNVFGPYSSEAVFYDALRGKYDVVLGMYHDQSLAPLKMVARDKLVNVTLGLPFIRTSPAHGTAFDIRDRLIANPGSMKNALRFAIDLGKKT